MRSTPTGPAQLVGAQLVGRVLAGGYLVESFIGEGGVGMVYGAVHLPTRRRVALKVLKPELTQDQTYVDLFLAEADNVARLGHEHIIDISYGGRTAEGLVLLAMERLDGTDLATLLEEEGALSWERARPLFLQATRALAAAHEAGVVHADLKPGNLFVVRGGDRSGDPTSENDQARPGETLKVLDFGAARVGARKGASPSEDGPLLATPQFMAPEQVFGEPVDARTDVYSMGCVMYRVITGELPFWSGDAMEVMRAHADEAPVPPRQRRPDLLISGAVEAVILRAMEKDPNRRYQSMNELTDAIARCRFSSTRSRTTSPPPLRLDDPVVRRARQMRRIAIGVALAVGAVTVAAWAGLR